MKYACISDLHLTWGKPIGRLDEVKETGIQKFAYLLKWCRDNDAELLIAGDLTHSSHGWYLYLAIMKEILKYKVIPKVVYGQHDMYFRTRVTTILNALEKNGLVKVIDGQDIFLYGYCWNDEEEDISFEIIKSEIVVPKILIIHAPITTKEIYPGGNFIDARQFLREQDAFDLIVCGDIHRKFHVKYKGRHIVNSGPMLRIDADEYMFDHEPGFWVYDSKIKEVEWEEIPHKSAEEVLSREHIERKKEIVLMMDDFIESISGEVDMDVDFEENVMLFIKENKIDEEVQQVLEYTMQEE